MATSRTSNRASATGGAKPTGGGDGKRQTLRERQRTLTRQALLDGAREVFEAKGYADVTIDEIAERAGTSRGTFYLYFTKGGVLAELIGEAFFTSIGSSPVTALLSDLHEAAPYTVESLAKWLRGYVSTWERNRSLVRAWMEGDAIDPEVQAQTNKRVARAVEVLTATLKEVRDGLGLPSDEDELRARATVMDLQLQYFCFHVIVRGLALDVETGIRAMAQQWYCAIFATTFDSGMVFPDRPPKRRK